MSIPDTIAQWCNDNGYTEPHLVEGKWWAFADGAVMAVPLPLPDDRSNAWFSLPRTLEIVGVDPARGSSSIAVSYLVPRRFFVQEFPEMIELPGQLAELLPTTITKADLPIPYPLQVIARLSSAYGVDLDTRILRRAADCMNEPVSTTRLESYSIGLAVDDIAELLE